MKRFMDTFNEQNSLVLLVKIIVSMIGIVPYWDALYQRADVDVSTCLSYKLSKCEVRHPLTNASFTLGNHVFFLFGLDGVSAIHSETSTAIGESL